VVDGPVSEQRKDSLDHVLLWPVLDRVAQGTITVRPDEYRWPWYYDGDRHCPFWYIPTASAYEAFSELGRIELIHPSPDSAGQVPDFGPRELAWGRQVGLSPERARLAVLTELGMREYQELRERQSGDSAMGTR
jgi:hypothetical protein